MAYTLPTPTISAGVSTIVYGNKPYTVNWLTEAT